MCVNRRITMSSLFSLLVVLIFFLSVSLFSIPLGLSLPIVSEIKTHESLRIIESVKHMNPIDAGMERSENTELSPKLNRIPAPSEITSDSNGQWYLLRDVSGGMHEAWRKAEAAKVGNDLTKRFLCIDSLCLFRKALGLSMRLFLLARLIGRSSSGLLYRLYVLGAFFRSASVPLQYSSSYTFIFRLCLFTVSRFGV